DYAGFWLRFAAVFIDGMLLSVINYGLYFGFLFGFRGKGEQFMFVTQIAISIIQMAISAGYEIWMIGKYGATLGKMACKIHVVTADGGPVSYARSTGRYFSKILSQIILMIGYIMAAFDDEKRALHDRICNTRVVKR
ncbi:MAG: RDD family protein, partial [Lentisphaerota bacterium]